MKCWLHCVEAFCFQIFYVWHDCNKASQTVEYGRVHKKARGNRIVMRIPHFYRIQAADLWVSTAFTLTLSRRNNAQIQKSKFPYIITNRDGILTASWNSSATSVCRLTTMAVVHTGKSMVYVLCSLRIPWRKHKRAITDQQLLQEHSGLWVLLRTWIIFMRNWRTRTGLPPVTFLLQLHHLAYFTFLGREKRKQKTHEGTVFIVFPLHISNFKSVSRFSHFIRTYAISCHRTYYHRKSITTTWQTHELVSLE